MKFWSFQPVTRPAVPAVKHKAWVRNPIDAFVLHRLEAAGLAPNPPASRTALIRRAYYDLTGLPPPRRRCARSWRTVARTPRRRWWTACWPRRSTARSGAGTGWTWSATPRPTATSGTATKPNAWRYRDYVIRSLQPGQAVRPVRDGAARRRRDCRRRTPERLIATGYYRLGIWDDEPVGPRAGAATTTWTTSSARPAQMFLGLTVGCARCHDHKLDPIPQKDYYRFLAFFAGVNRYGERGAAVPIASGSAEQTQKQQAEIAAHEAKVKANAGRSSPRSRSRCCRTCTPVEKEEFQHEAARAADRREARAEAAHARRSSTVTARCKRSGEAARQFQPTALDRRSA